MKQFDLQGNEYDIQIKEMLDNIPKSNNVASAYTGISVDELQTIIDKFKTLPNYNDLIADNNRKDKVINDLLKRISDLEFEVERLEKENKSLIEENKRFNNLIEKIDIVIEQADYKSRIDKAIDYIEQPENISSVAFCQEDGEIMNLYKIDSVKSLELLDILKGVDKN